jgi:hypothetical protein
MLPMLGIAALYFRYRKGIKQLKPTCIWDIMLWFSVIGFLFIGLWSLYNLFQPAIMI